MDPAPKLSISNVGTQYQFSNAYLLFKDQFWADIKGGLIGLNTNIKCI